MAYIITNNDLHTFIESENDFFPFVQKIKPELIILLQSLDTVKTDETVQDGQYLVYDKDMLSIHEVHKKTIVDAGWMYNGQIIETTICNTWNLRPLLVTANIFTNSYVSKLEHSLIVAQHEDTISRYEKTIALYMQQISSNTKEISEHALQISHLKSITADNIDEKTILQQIIATYEQKIDDLTKITSEYENLANRNVDIDHVNKSTIAIQNEQIAKHENTIASQNEQIVKHENTIATQEEKIAKHVRITILHQKIVDALNEIIIHNENTIADNELIKTDNDRIIQEYIIKDTNLTIAFDKMRDYMAQKIEIYTQKTNDINASIKTCADKEKFYQSVAVSYNKSIEDHKTEIERMLSDISKYDKALGLHEKTIESLKHIVSSYENEKISSCSHHIVASKHNSDNDEVYFCFSCKCVENIVENIVKNGTIDKDLLMYLIVNDLIGLDMISSNSDTLLIYACKNQFHDIALKLIELYPSNVGFVNEEGNTALTWSSCHHMYDVVKILLATGN